jgi:hypothetical protein
VASKTVVELFDDLDGGRADETVVFALDGVEYEIDLSKSNATALRDVLAAYIAHGHRVTGRSRGVTRTAAAVVPEKAEKAEKPAKAKPKSAINSNASMTAEIRRLASESARKVSQAKVVEVVDDDDEPDLFSTEPGVVEERGTTEVGPVPALIIPFQEASL